MRRLRSRAIQLTSFFFEIDRLSAQSFPISRMNGSMQHPTGYFPIRDLFLPFLCPFRFPASNRPAASSGIALNGYGSSFLSKYYLILPPLIAEEASSLVEFPVPAPSVDVPVPNRPSPVEDQTVLRHVPVKENLGIVFRICYAPWSPVFEQNRSARRMLLSERTVCWIPRSSVISIRSL